MTHSVTLLIGSNDILAAAMVLRAAELLTQRVGKEEAASQLYRSEAWGFESENPFYNQALRLTTTLEPLEVIDLAQEIEQLLGRRRDEEQAERAKSGQRYASRKVDIDIIFYDDCVIDTERLVVPHPLLQEREFALRPLCEIMGNYRHPVLGKSLEVLLKELE